MDAEKSPRANRRGRFDIANMTLSLGPRDPPVCYPCSDLSDDVRTYLMLMGLKAALLRSKHPDLVYQSFLNGVIPAQRKRKVRRRSKWNEAIAHTLAATKAFLMAPKGTKKSITDAMAKMEFAAMLEHVEGLDRVARRKLTDRPDVCDTYRRLFGKRLADQQISLFEQAGVILPPLTVELINHDLNADTASEQMHAA